MRPKERLLDLLEEMARGVMSIALYVGLVGGAGYFAYGYVARFVQAEPAASASAAVVWLEGVPPQPALSLEMGDFLAGAAIYRMRKHPTEGRHDIVTWRDADAPSASLTVDVYRPGPSSAPKVSDVTFAPAPGGPLTMLSKFGAFAVRRGTDGKGRPCVDFSLASPAAAEIAGVHCGNADAQRALETIACALDRLTLVNAHGDVDLAGVFARARLKQSSCRPGKLPLAAVPQADAWIDKNGSPALRAGAT